MLILKPPKGVLLQPGDPLAKGLVGYWPMNEAAGNKIFDASGNGNTGGLYGDATVWIPGQNGPCLSFGGSDDYMAVADSPTLMPTTLTVNVWVRTTTSANYRWVFSKGGGTNGYELALGASNVMYFEVRNGSTPYIAQPTFPYADGKWHMCTLTFDGSTVAAYVDGVFRASTTSAIMGTTTAQLTFAARYQDGNYIYDFTGQLDNISIFSRAITASEIASLYVDPHRLLRRRRIELWTAAMGGGGGTVPLAGTIAALSSVAALASVAREIVGSVVASSAVSGAVEVAKKLAGIAGASSAVSGAVEVAKKLVGIAGATSTVSGAVEVAKKLVGIAGATSTVSGAMSVARKVAGTIAAASAVAGELTGIGGEVVLSGVVSAASVVSGALKMARKISGSTAAVSSVSGVLDQCSLAGICVAVSSVSGSLFLKPGLVKRSGDPSPMPPFFGDVYAWSRDLSDAIERELLVIHEDLRQLFQYKKNL